SHESPHEFHRSLDRGSRLTNEKEAAGRNENEGGDRDHNERGDQISVSVFKLDPVSYGHRDELATRSELEAQRVKPERPVFLSVVLSRDLAHSACIFGRLANP